MKRWKNKNIDGVIRKLKPQCYDSAEAELMLAIYEQALLDYHALKKLIHTETVRLRTYKQKEHRELGRLEIFLSGKIPLTQKNLDRLMQATTFTQKTRVRILGIEKKIMGLKPKLEEIFKFLTHQYNWALYYAGIEPLYAIRLLNEIQLFN